MKHFGKMPRILLSNAKSEMFIKILKRLRKKLLDCKLTPMLPCKRQNKDILSFMKEELVISLKDVKRAKIHQF
jgi:hypothetical protein